jgi:hypothetical protein
MRRQSRLERNLGLLLLALYGAFFLWQTPSLWQAPLTAEETESYLARLQSNMFASAEEKAVFVRDLRAWAAGDDGQPVFMVNLLRYNAELIPFYATRQPDGISFEVEMEAPIAKGSALEMTTALSHSLEARVRSRPEQWFWVHRRWA